MNIEPAKDAELWFGLPETEREAAVLRLAREEAQRPFDLTRGPLLRVHLIRLGAYVSGTSSKLDAAIRTQPDLMGFLRQERSEESPLSRTLAELDRVTGLLA